MGPSVEAGEPAHSPATPWPRGSRCTHGGRVAPRTAARRRVDRRLSRCEPSSASFAHDRPPHVGPGARDHPAGHQGRVGPPRPRQPLADRHPRRRVRDDLRLGRHRRAARRPRRPSSPASRFLACLLGLVFAHATNNLSTTSPITSRASTRTTTSARSTAPSRSSTACMTHPPGAPLHRRHRRHRAGRRHLPGRHARRRDAVAARSPASSSSSSTPGRSSTSASASSP